MISRLLGMWFSEPMPDPRAPSTGIYFLQKQFVGRGPSSESQYARSPRPNPLSSPLVEPSAVQDHWATPLRPRGPRLHLLRTRNMKDVRLPPSRRERFECCPQLRSCIQPRLQLLRNRILRRP